MYAVYFESMITEYPIITLACSLFFFGSPIAISIRYYILNTMLDNYASAKLAFLHPSKLHVSTHSNMPYK